jgi:hypothetical protein
MTSYKSFFKYLCPLIALSPYLALAQHGEPIDVSKCFSNILIDKRTDYSHNSLRYALLASWSRELYENAKTSGSITSLLPQAPGIASFEASDEARLKELHSHNESLDYDNVTASSAAWLDPQAGSVIKQCLDDQVRSGFGLSSVVYIDNERDATLLLFWNWAPGGTPVLVKTRHIANATVADDSGKHPQQLLPPHAFYSDWGQMSYSASVSLERIKLDQDIVINIETEPDIGAQHIVIPKVPLKQNCPPTQESADKFGTPYSVTVSSLAEQLPVIRDDGSGHKHVDYNLDITTLPNGKDGIIDSVGCRKSSATLFADIDNPVGEHSSGTVATCHGSYQNLGSTFEMHVVWHKTGYACTPIPWASPSKTK